MGGIKYFALLAVLAAAVSAENEFDTKNCTYCPPCQVNNPFDGPVGDVCSYCHCDTDLKPVLRRCPEKMEFDPTVQECVPSTRCKETPDDRCKDGHDQYCRECYHGMGIQYPASDGCGYCQCLDDGGSEFITCPPGMGWDNHKCVPKDECCVEHACDDKECQPCYHGMNYRFPDKYDNCGFCCCEPVEGNSTHEHAVYKECPKDMIFDVDLNRCIYDENRQCHKRECHTTTPPPITYTTPEVCHPHIPCNFTCPLEEYGKGYRRENPDDPCGFCCCEPEEGNPSVEVAIPKQCPERSEYYDAEHDTCKLRSIPCETPSIPKPEHCRDPNDKDGCYLLIEYCKTDADGHLPNPYDSRSFCQCEFNRIHWMPCAPGTQMYIDSLGACV